MRINGAFIDSGVQDWQIIQRHDGFGTITLTGCWNIPAEETAQVGCVQLRLMEEATNRTVIGWQDCETTFAEDRRSGNWSHTLTKIPQGGLYRLETRVYCGDIVWGVRGDMVHHIGVGDIFVIIGQSNASGYGRDHVQDAPQIGVHMLRARGSWDLASHPFNDSTDTIYPDNREGANPGCNPYLHFAKTLQKALNIPIGLIPAAEGGSPICDWLPQQQGYLYRNMERYLQDIGNDFTAFLWYQGCTDCQAARNPERYLEDFTLLCQTLRNQYGEKPIYTTQLNKVTTDYTTENGYPKYSWGTVRNAQRLAAKQLSKVYVVPSYDLPTSDEIHNSASANLVIGERLAELALDTLYQQPGYANSHAPDIASISKVSPNETALSFDHCKHLYMLLVPKTMLPFLCVDEKGEILPQKMTVLDDSTLKVTWDREICGNAKVSFVPEALGSMRLLFDQESYLPPLAFADVPVK